MESGMTALRLISLPTHAAIELAFGLVVMAAPFLLGFSAAGLVVTVLLGALIVGLALSAVPVEGRSAPIAAHFAYDRGVAIGLLGSALVLGIAGDVPATILLTAAALSQALLNVTTRYSAGH
jgi:hypothetical protein